MKIVDNWLIDDSNNMVDLSKYKKKKAKEMLKSLKYSTNCVNSENCTGCKVCIDCIDCTKCENCVDCINCRKVYNKKHQYNKRNYGEEKLIATAIGLILVFALLCNMLLQLI